MNPARDEVLLVQRSPHEWQEAVVLDVSNTSLELQYLTGPWRGVRFFTPLHEEGRIWVRIRKNGGDR